MWHQRTHAFPSDAPHIPKTQKGENAAVGNLVELSGEHDKVCLHCNTEDITLFYVQ